MRVMRLAWRLKGLKARGCVAALQQIFAPTSHATFTPQITLISAGVGRAPNMEFM